MIAVAYLVGGIPWGLLLGRWFRGVDIRAYGSGKTGATNAARTLGWRISGLVFVLDVLKGVVAVLLARWVTDLPLVESLAGMAAILGHCFSPYIRFGGGRGVATGAGATLVIAPFAVVAVAVVGSLAIRVSRYVSLGSILGALVVPVSLIVGWLLGWVRPEHIVYGIGGGAIIVAKHHDNIRRLLAGTERKIGERATTRSAAGGSAGAD